MRKKQIAPLLIGAGIGYYIPGFTGPLAMVNPWIGLVAITIGAFILLAK